MPKQDQITAISIGIPHRIDYLTMWDLLTSGNYKYEGYDQIYKAHKYVLIRQVKGAPEEIYDHNPTRRV